MKESASIKIAVQHRPGRPCGEEDFVIRLEVLLGRRFATLAPDRPYIRKNKEMADFFQKEDVKEYGLCPQLSNS